MFFLRLALTCSLWFQVCLILERENAARKALETEAASPRASQTSRPHERTQNQPHQRPLHNQAPTSSARAPRPISQVTHGSSAVARGIQQHAHAGGQGPAHSANQPSSNSPLRSLSTAGGGTHQMRAIYAQSAVNLQSARSFLEGVYKRESQEMVWSTEEEMNTRWRLPVQVLPRPEPPLPDTNFFPCILVQRTRCTVFFEVSCGNAGCAGQHGECDKGPYCRAARHGEVGRPHFVPVALVLATNVWLERVGHDD